MLYWALLQTMLSIELQCTYQLSNKVINAQLMNVFLINDDWVAEVCQTLLCFQSNVDISSVNAVSSQLNPLFSLVVLPWFFSVVVRTAQVELLLLSLHVQNNLYKMHNRKDKQLNVHSQQSMWTMAARGRGACSRENIGASLILLSPLLLLLLFF